MSTSRLHFNHVAVLGAGESGVAVARLFAAEGTLVTVLDSAPEEALGLKAKELSLNGIALIAGEAALAVPPQTDLAVLSPGVDPVSEQVRAFVKAGVPLSGELEEAFKRCRCPVVAITGTNGKTTTTQLVEAMFNAASVPTRACGNIGPAFASHVSESVSLSVMTLEVSSFQLETIETFHPRVSVWLNFEADHLDRYPSMQEYYAAKLQIFKNQTESDWAIINARDRLPPLKARTLTFSAYDALADFVLQDGWICFKGEKVLQIGDTHLKGLHNAENLMAALAVGHAWGLPWKSMVSPLCSYKPLPHRCELVGTLDAVDYVNDSKATNLDALQKALLSEARPVVLIAGGKDKGFGFESLTDLVAERCRSAVLIGEMASRIQEQWSSGVPCLRAASLADAVALAKAAAQAGDVVLFSPGTSSFDMFKNYADRGNQFRALVNQLSA